MSSNFLKRSLSALILFPLLILLILKGSYFHILIVTLFCLFICWYEWSQLFNFNKFYFIYGYIILFLSFLLIHNLSFLYLVYFCFFLLFLPFLFSFEKERFIVEYFPLLAGIFYLFVGFIPLLILARDYPREYLIYFFSVVFSADTGAYLAGKSLGRRPFFSKISPKKTLEGFLGGITASLLVGIMLSLFLKLWGIGLALLISLLLSLTEAIGDLFESAVKRAVGKKDSGAIIPGHGGLLDRIDGVLFASPAFLILLDILKTWN